MGNVVSSGENLATFFYDQWTLGSGLLSESAMLQIVSYFKPLYDWTVPDAYRGRTEWWIYGLGTFLLPTDRYLTNFTDENRGKVRALGHPGEVHCARPMSLLSIQESSVNHLRFTLACPHWFALCASELASPRPGLGQR